MKCGFWRHQWEQVAAAYGRGPVGSTYYFTKRCTNCGKTVTRSEFLEDLR